MADELAGEVSSLMDEKQPVNPGDSKKSNKICFFYARNKRCKFGDECRFVHSDKKTKILKTTSGESPESVVESSGLSMNEKVEIPTSVSSEIMISAQENSEDTNEGIVKEPSSSEDLDSNQTKSHDDHQIAATERTTERHDSKDSKEPKRTSKQRCRFFSTKAGCARGDACKFSHAKPKNHRKQHKAPKEQNMQNQKAKEGDGKKETTKDTVTKLKANEKQGNRTITRVVPTSTRLSMLDDNEVKNLRTRELNQLERGFGKLGLKTVNENNQTTYYINFTPSDPDWPFDIEVILLAVIFPEKYPKVMFKAFLSEEQDLPLELIRFTNKGISRWLEQQQAARSTKDTVDLPFRPFLRWLDRNIEELFIEAAREMKKKEAAMDANEEESLDMNESYHEEDSSERKEMLKHEKGKVESDSENMDPNKAKEHHRSRTEKKTQQKQKRKDNSYSYTSSERKELLLSDFLTFKKPNKNKGSKEAVSSKGSHGDRTQTEDSPKDHIVFVDQDLSLKKAENQAPENAQNDLKVDGEDTNFESYEGYQIHDMPKGEPLSQGVGNDQHRGTEIRFKELELSENSSTLTTNFVTLMMECLKCKTKTDIKVEKARSSAVRCDKCSNVLRITFRPAIIHQYSSTLGYLDLEGWHPFDLIMTEMQLTAGCLACSSETSIKGPHYGTNQVWCGKCHQKLAFKVESTRFFELTPTGVQDKNDVLLEKPKKKPKTPGLKEGFPLPDNGTCKHYKKSHRWLRFPCCGKCYPCDICHEEHEDHEMKFANRMVCGFCSKEQPYSQNPCVACNSSTTKAKTSHWEGGRGCRNKTLMSKGDDKKFKNTMKTTSRKAQAKETPKAKPK